MSLKVAPRRRLIVLSFDSLATAAVGCYGSSWNQTPAIDVIATGGAVWDRLMVTDDRSDPILRRWFGSHEQKSDEQGWSDAWQKFGSRELITDNAGVGQSAKCFDHVVTISHDVADASDLPADDIESTRLASLVAAAIERDAEEPSWSVMWLHSDFLSRAWDAPRSLFPIDEVELDRPEPDEYGEVEDLDATDDGQPATDPIFDDVVVPHFSLGPSDREDPDLITSWMRTYGCQVRLIDWMIEVLLSSIEVEDPIVMIVGTGGFSLGQNGWIGRGAGPLRSPEIRVPLVVSDIGPVRMPAITSTDMVPSLLRDLAMDGLATSEAAKSCWSPEHWVMPMVDDRVPTRSDRVIAAVTTPQWFYVRELDQHGISEEEHLYLKPDDVDDFNDIGRLRLDVIDQLRQ